MFDELRMTACVCLVEGLVDVIVGAVHAWLVVGGGGIEL